MTYCENPEHDAAEQHRNRTKHMVVCPTREGIPWPEGLRTRPYCLDCDWPEKEDKMKSETKAYIRKTAITGFVLGLVAYIFFGLLDTTGSKWGLHVFVWDIFAMSMGIVIVDLLKHQEIFARKE